METIKGKCFTNLDDYDVSIVTEFARVPNIGERVTAYYKGNITTLKVCQITHSIKNIHGNGDHNVFNSDIPYIIVELHK